MSSSTPFLDDQAGMRALDAQNALGSIEMLGSQIQQIWQQAETLDFGTTGQDITNVVVAGMGGSVLGTHVIQTLFKEYLKVPVLIAPDYDVPSFVDKHTLVIASSYSGTTEETLAAVNDAIAKGAKIAGITSGGKLAELLTQRHCPALVFAPNFNPAANPRMALGYSIFGQMALFAKAGLLPLTEKDYQNILAIVADAHLRWSSHVNQEQNGAKQLAFELLGRIPVITTAEHIEGMAHVFANQLNENAKTFAEYRTVPEMNHHLLEGLQFPETLAITTLFVTVHSSLYGEGNQKRMTLTEDVIAQNHGEFRSLTLTADTKIGQAFEFLVFAAYTSFYLAMLNNQNPTPNPWVDWFKAELKKR